MARFIRNGVFKDGLGRSVKAGLITVTLATTSTVAVIYDASSGGNVITDGKITTNDDGTWFFYADNSDYSSTQLFDIQLSKTGFTTKKYFNEKVIQTEIEVFNAAGTRQANQHAVVGNVTLSGGTFTVTLVGSAAFTNTSSYEVVSTDSTALNVTRVDKVSGSSFTIKGNTTNVIGYIAIGS